MRSGAVAVPAAGCRPCGSTLTGRKGGPLTDRGKVPCLRCSPAVLQRAPDRFGSRPPSPLSVVQLVVRSLFTAVKGLLSRPLEGVSLCLLYASTPVIHLFYRPPFPHASGYVRGSRCSRASREGARAGFRGFISASTLSASSAVQASRQGQGRPISLLSASSIPAVL